MRKWECQKGDSSPYNRGMHTVGIYPGTFDPVHAGHIAFALEAERLCRLDEVVFLPEHLPRGKRTVTSLADRVTLLRSNLTHEGLKVTELGSRQFTVKDTLPEILRLFPGSELTLLVGSDVVQTSLHRWEDLATLLSHVSLAIGMRGNDPPDAVHRTMRSLEASYGMTIAYKIMRTEHADLASSLIRLRQLAAEA